MIRRFLARRAGVVLLNVVVFTVILGPLATLSMVLLPALPWWSIAFAVCLLALLARRRRLVAVPAEHGGPESPDGPRFAPTGQGGF
jgi:hypothetical protein